MKETQKNKGKTTLLSKAVSNALLLLVAFLLYVTCGIPKKPIDFAMGKFQCDYCRMTIADKRFRGEIITRKGKVYRFDSIECLKAWQLDHPKYAHLASTWVADAFYEGKWVALDKALILHSPNIRTPMGGGLAAFSDETGITAAHQEYGGERLDRQELENYIRKWKKK